MADAPNPNPNPNPEPEPEPVVVPEGAKNPDAVQKALSAERDAAKAARKDADDLRARLKEFEDKDKSEQELLSESAKAAEARAQQAETAAKDAADKLLRYEIAAAKGLGLKHASRLVGSTREEMEADADELLKDVRPSDGLDGGARRPPASDANVGPGRERLEHAYNAKS